MSTYVLVHGAWHGGWCWQKVLPLLEDAGHTVLAPDLPSLGEDLTPIHDVTLALWRDSIVRLIEQQSDPVILVGHSRGGVVISEVAEKIPDRIAKLVYLTAFLAQDGESVIAIAQTDAESSIGPYFSPSADGSSMSILDEGVVPVFYADCLPEDAAWAKSLLRPEPMVGIATPVHVTAANFGRVPRAYIFCENDRAIGLATQKKMAAGFPCEKTATLATSHSPFISAPEKLVAALTEVAG